MPHVHVIEPTEADVVDLVENAKLGEEAAYSRLVAIHGRRLRILVIHRLGPGPHGGLDVEDILQETFIEAFRLLPRFSWTRPGSFLRWPAAIAEHQVQRALRRRDQKRHEVPIGSGLLSSSRPAPGGVRPFVGGESPERLALRQEALDRVERALASLSPARREAVVLAFFHSLRPREIAERMGRTPQAVSLLVFRALRQLQATLRPARGVAADAVEAGRISLLAAFESTDV